MNMDDDADDRELEAQGYQPALPRRFSLLSLLSLSFALTATWNGFGSAIGTSLAYASSAGTLWTVILAAVMNLVVSLGMAELVSAYPNSGAQYYWSFRVASHKWAPFASYMSACVSTAGWWLGLASVCNFIAAMVFSVIQLCRRDHYAPHPGYQWLCYVAILWLAVALNVFGTRALPACNRFFLYFSIATLGFTVAAMLKGGLGNFRSATEVFTDTASWNTTYDRSFLLVLCLLNNTYGFMGTDAGAHLAEEIPNPRVNAPKVIVYPVLIGLATVWPFAVVCMFAITDISAVINPPSGFALIEIYRQATDNELLTVILLACFAICLFGCAVANVTGSSRQIWAAARDDCYPLSAWLREIHPKYEMPANAAYLSAIFTTFYGLIFLGSETAFESMVSANIVFMMVSYVIPQGIMVVRGRSVLPERPFNLGRWGFFVNAISCMWVCVLSIVACVPTTLPVTMSNMNWVGVVVVLITAYTVIAWRFWQRHIFKGPQIGSQRRHSGLETVPYIDLGGLDSDSSQESLMKATKAD